MRTRIYSIWIWSAFIFSLIIFFPLACIIWLLLFPFDKNRAILHYLTGYLASFFIAINPFLSLKTTGINKIRRDRTYIIISNHQSILDVLLIYKIKMHFKWVSKLENFSIPVIGQIMKMNKYIGVKRGDKESVICMMEKSKYFLSKGISIFIFPEGTRSDNGEPGEFKEGAFRLAKESGLPILPLILTGTGKTLPKKGFLLRGKHIVKLHVLDELSPDYCKNKSIPELTEKVRQYIIQCINRHY